MSTKEREEQLLARRTSLSIPKSEQTLKSLPEPITPPPIVRCKSTLSVRDLKALGLYSNEDLQPYEGRPGALDAFKLPSLRFGIRHDPL